MIRIIFLTNLMLFHFTNIVIAQIFNYGEIYLQPEATIHIGEDFDNHNEGTVFNEGKIYIGGNWSNWATKDAFSIDAGTLFFKGNNQYIEDGYSVFDKVELLKTTLVKLKTPTNIGEILALNNGILDLNGKELNLYNSASIALTSNEGYLHSTNDLGRIKWHIGNKIDVFNFPFATNDGVAVPVSFDIINAGHSEIIVNTYATDDTNLPMPTGISDMQFGGKDIALNAFDRFWYLGLGGATADVSLFYSQEDINNNDINLQNLHLLRHDGQKWNLVGLEKINDGITASITQSGWYVIYSSEILTVVDDNADTDCNIDLILNVLANDIGVDLTITDISIVPGVTITYQGGGLLNITGVATESFSFNYTAEDNTGNSSTATVYINVTVPDEIWYNGVDDNCDGADDYDQDGDGFVSNEYADVYIGNLPLGDCDDLDGNIHPDADDICDYIDNNCDGKVDNTTCTDLPSDVSTGFSFSVDDQDVTFKPISLSECDEVKWTFTGATTSISTSVANESITVTFLPGNNIKACMSVVRYNLDNSTCEETFCSTVTSVKDLYQLGLKIYPNPAGDRLYLEVPLILSSQFLFIEIEDLLGRQLYQKKEYVGSKVIGIELNNLVQGQYLLKIKDSKGNIYINKFVKN